MVDPCRIRFGLAGEAGSQSKPLKDILYRLAYNANTALFYPSGFKGPDSLLLLYSHHCCSMKSLPRLPQVGNRTLDLYPATGRQREACRDERIILG
jgi:hypothetical protein